VKDARQHRFDALGFCRHVAMKKFSAGALVAATLAGQWFAVPSNAGTTPRHHTTVATTTTTSQLRRAALTMAVLRTMTACNNSRVKQRAQT